jgi:predicted transcriptional regulator
MTMDELMRRLPYSQIELADMCGVTPSAVCHFIKGRGNSLKIAHALDVLAGVEPGTAYAAAKAVQQERYKKAQRRLEKLGIDIQPPAATPDEYENP